MVSNKLLTHTKAKTGKLVNNRKFHSYQSAGRVVASILEEESRDTP
jgi:hypothetical protein